MHSTTAHSALHATQHWPCHLRSDATTHQRTLHTVQLDNRWVVPHNRYLSLRYDCHINLEVCINVASIKYLYKYAYKGGDRAAADVTTDPNSTTHSRNEIQQYLDARYLSAGEAVWRLLGFRMHSEVPHVRRLAVHLLWHATAAASSVRRRR